MKHAALLLLALLGCGRTADGSDTSSPPATGTGPTTACLAEEVVFNGADDDCDGWADEFGDGYRTLTDEQRMLTGSEGLLLGEWMDVGHDVDGNVWLVAGGISAQSEGTPAHGAVVAMSQPGAQIHRIEGDYSFDTFGYGVAVGAFEGNGVRVFANQKYGTFGYTGEESSWTEHATTLRGGVGWADDVDQDGVDELMTRDLDGQVMNLVVLDGPVTSPQWTTERARIYVDYSAPQNPDPPPWNFTTRNGAVGDLTGDGVLEMALPTTDEPGRQWIVPADTTGVVSLFDVEIASLRGEEVNNTSTSPPAIGDANGDGYLDLLTGAALANERAGKAYLVYGPFSGDHLLAQADAAFPGDFDNDWCGWQLTFTPDLDGDGGDEPIIACPRDRYLGTQAPGRVELFLGADARGTVGIDDASAVWVEGLTTFAGWNIEGRFDLTEDGIADLAIAVPGDSTAVPHAGAVYVLPGPLL